MYVVFPIASTWNQLPCMAGSRFSPLHPTPHPRFTWNVEWQWKRERQGKGDLAATGSLPKRLQWAARPNTGTWNTMQVFPHEWQGSKFLSHLPMLSQVHSQEAESEVQQPGYTDTGCRCNSISSVPCTTMPTPFIASFCCWRLHLNVYCPTIQSTLGAPSHSLPHWPVLSLHCTPLLRNKSIFLFYCLLSFTSTNYMREEEVCPDCLMCCCRFVD